MPTAYRFIGPKRSMGLVPGNVYSLIVTISMSRIVARWANGACPYNSVEAFTSNWERVK